MPNYASGMHSRAMCSRCGWEYSYLSLQMEWTGLYTCPTCWDMKHEQLTPIKHVDDPQALSHPYPDQDNDGTVATQLEDTITIHHGATS